MTNVTYREVFFAHNGPGPWPCFFCGEEVLMTGVWIHHIDLDHFHDVSENLSPSHPGCHAGYHSALRVFSQTDLQKQRASETFRGVPKSAEQVAKMVATKAANGTSLSFKGRTHSKETRFKMSQSALANAARKKALKDE